MVFIKREILLLLTQIALKYNVLGTMNPLKGLAIGTVYAPIFGKAIKSPHDRFGKYASSMIYIN